MSHFVKIKLYVFTSDRFRNVLPERINCTDASNRVCAGYCLHILGKIFHKRWTEEDCRSSSSWRKRKAMELTLKLFKRTT